MMMMVMMIDDDMMLQGIKFKVIGPPSSQDVIDACAKDAVR